jgi:hypothetical protein
MKNLNDVKEVSRKEGVLDYPLSRSEISYLLQNLKKQPIICSTDGQCRPLDKVPNAEHIFAIVARPVQPVIQEWIEKPIVEDSGNMNIVKDKIKRELIDILDITKDTWEQK